MQRPTNAWSRFNNGSSGRNVPPPPAPAQQLYDHDDADTNGWNPQQAPMYNGWMMAEACKVKDALFIGNLLAVQVSSAPASTSPNGLRRHCPPHLPVVPASRRCREGAALPALRGARRPINLVLDRFDKPARCARQDINFVTTNKIQYCIKCHTGFPAPPHLKRFAYNSLVLKLTRNNGYNTII